MALALDPRYIVEIHPAADRLPDMHSVYVRRRIAVGLIALVLAAAVSLGIRSLASRGDGAAPVSAVTPATVRTADVILVLQEGRLVAQGRHDSLLADCPVYRDLFAETPSGSPTP